MVDAAELVLTPSAVAVLAAMLGAIVGSFLGAALARMPEGRSVITGRSCCDGCGKALATGELIPIVSWLIQRGRCRHCGAKIGALQLGCELGGAAISAMSVVYARDGSAFPAMLLGWQLLLLGLLDLKHFWLPRVAIALLAISGLAVAFWNAWASDGAIPLLTSLGGGVLGFAMLWLIGRLYLQKRGREGMGQGDPPLLGAIGLWLGPLGVVETMLGASIVGIAAAIALLVGGRKVEADTALPLGTCLAIVAWPIFVLQGPG